MQSTSSKRRIFVRIDTDPPQMIIRFEQWLLLWLVATAWLQAQPVILSPGSSSYEIGPYIATLEDPTHQLTLADVCLRHHQFTPSTQEVPNLGVSASAFWVRFTLLNEAVDQPWLLEDYFRHVGKLDVYLVNAQGRLIGQYRAGDWRGKAHRPLPTHNYVFPLRLPIHQPVTVYMRVENITGKIFPLRVWQEMAFWRDAQIRSFLIGLYFSIIGVIMLYFLILFVYNNYRGYLYFSLFLFFFLCSELIRGNGNLFIRYWGVQHPFWSLHIVETYNTLLVLAAVANLYFYSESLQLRQYQPKLHRLLMSVWIIHALLIPIIWLRVFPMIFSLGAFFVAPVGGYLAAGFASAVRWRQGLVSAKYYLAGSLFFFCGLLITLLSYANLLKINDLFFQNLLNLASILEISCLSLGFVHSIRNEREAYIQQLETANAELLTMNEEIAASLFQGQILERKRVERELHDGLSSVLFGVRASLFGIQPDRLSPVQQQSYQAVETLLARAEKEVQLIAHNQFPPELEEQGLSVALTTFVDDLNTLNVTQFNLVLVGLPNRLSRKTEFELFSIVRELSANILKHARATSAEIRLEQHRQHLQLSVRDNGRGFDPAGKSRGLGMKNLHHRVSELAGELILESDERGTVVTIRLSQAVPSELPS